MINFLKKKYLYDLWKPFSFFVTRNKTSMHNFLIQSNLYVLSWVGFYTYDELNWIENFSTRKNLKKSSNSTPPDLFTLLPWLKRILINETQLPWRMLFLYLLDKFDSFNGRKISLLKAPKSVSCVTRVLMIYP